MSGIRLKSLPVFPASLTGRVGTNVVKQNGNYYIDLNYAEFPTVSSTPAGSYFLTYDPIVGNYALAPTTQQITGYGTPTGNVKTSNFPGATATLLQTSQQLAQLIIDLQTLGLLGV